MKIGVNLLSLVPGKIGGMEQYIRNLIWYAATKCEGYEFFLFLNTNNYESFSDDQEKIHRVLVADDREVERNLLLYSKINQLNLEVWFCPLLVIEPAYVNIPTIVTIPDIQHEFFPNFFSDEVLEWRRKNFKFSAQKSSAVLTLSDFSKSTIIDKYEVQPDKVYSIYLDSTKEFYLAPDEERKKQIAEKYCLPSKFAFYPANTWPHKNHVALLKAIKILKDKYSVRVNLVLTGSENQAQESIREYIKENGLNDQIQFLGYINQEDMPYIYINADFLVFPSLFEGFGIPLVEAMRTETPILCSNAGSIPEVVNDCAIMFDPENPEEIALAILKLDDQKLRADMIRKGAKQLEKFSWDNCSKETLQVFEKVVAQSKMVEYDYPLVSIITPSYNQGKFIKETIESVLNQDYPNIEYIVMDGGSKDETIDILKSYGDRIKWVSEPDEGQADAVNKGVKVAKGEIIGWLNSDDTYLPHAIKQAVDFLLFHKEVAMVYGEGYHTTEQGEIIERYPTESFNYNRLAETCFICQPTGFIRKAVFEEVGLLNKDLHLCMDYELWMRIGKFYPIGYIPQFLATSRMYEDNKTLSRRKEVFKEIIATVKIHYNYVPISWLYGYVDYLLGPKRSYRFYSYLLFFILRYNINNLRFFTNSAKHIIKSKIKQKMNAESFKDRYEDGWVSKEFITTIDVNKSKNNKIKITGRHLWPYDDSLQILVSVNNQKTEKFRISDKGTFNIELNLPEMKSERKAKLNLIANKTFNPKKLKINDDSRDLAYIIDYIES